jgi:serine/threonine-protein kinase
MATSVPSKIGKYDVLGVVGRGGMGIVYKAIDPRLDREVAIKMMTGGFVDDPDLRKRFFREAQSLANLQHPNIVTVYDLGDYEGNPYLVMQYLEGETLDVAMAQHRELSLLEKFNIIIQVCSGLAYSHKRFVVHRDIKPANIMLEKDGGTKIFDFGIAHVGDQSVTKTGQMVGTPPYMSPEQINGKTVDARSDLFSVGVVLYQLLTGHLPFQGDSPAGTFLKILYDPIPPLKTYLPSYPQELNGILERALAKDPADRYHSADEFSLDVGHLLSQFRQEVVDRQMREVGLLLERSELQKARDLLIQVLRTDAKHLPASQSLRDVERRIKKEEISGQVRRLRQQADEAFSQRHFEAAQALLEQALAIDNTDRDLRQHAESVRAAIVQARKLREALKSAESAHQDGDLDIAKLAIEEAVQIAPNDTQAKALYRVIQREWMERSRQRQIETHLFQARQQISARKFTDALETLRLADALDPHAPQIHSLIETATAGLEQQRRRKEIEVATREIESALNSDDYRGACQKAEEALSRFPEERTIIKLKALAERQRQIEERRQLVEEQLALARKLLQANRNDELLASLEATIAKIGPEPRLQSLLGVVTENVQRERLERRKSEALQRARELLRRQQYDSAIRTLESARAKLKNEPELDDFLQFVKEEAAAETRRCETEAVAQKARAFVAEQKYDDAIRVLETALQQNTDPDLRIALAEIRRVAAEYHERMETALVSAEKMLHARKFVEAVTLLESQPPAYFRNPSFSTLLESAHSQAERMRRVREVVDQSQRLCDNGDYVGAPRVLDEWRQRNGTEPELDAQYALIGQRRIDAACRIAEKAISEVRDLVSSREYQAGLDKLQSIAELVADLPEAMETEYRSLRQVAATGLVDSRKSQIEESVDNGELTRAGNILRQALVQFPGESNLSELGKVVEGETTRRGAAQRKLAQAQAAFDEQHWHTGTELLAEAFTSANRATAARAKVIDAFVQAAFLAVETDWRAAEGLLKRLATLKPDYDPPSLLRLQISEHEREEAVGRYLGHAKALIAMGKLQEAVDKVSEGLKFHNDDVTLMELRKSVLERIRQEEAKSRQERARLEKDAFLRDLSSRVEREPSLDRRIEIIEEALTRFPQEQQLRHLSSAMRDLALRIISIREDALKLEAVGKYDDALAQWNVLRSLHPLQPELNSDITRVTRLREQVRTKIKAEWVEKIRRELTASDFERTQALLREAAQLFPRDQALFLLEVQLADAIKAREKAEKYLVEASRAFDKLRWAKGIEALSRALESAPSDVVMKNRFFNSITKAVEAVWMTDLQAARLLLARATVLAPSSAVMAGLEQKIKEREREQAVIEHLNRVRRVQQGGDLESARAELDLAMRSYPDEQRFVQAKIEVEGQLQQIEERKSQERERQRHCNEEHERKRASAAEKRKHEHEAKRLRKEKRRKEAIQEKKRKAAPTRVPPHENAEMSATRVLSAPEPPAPRAAAKAADRSEKESIPQANQLASVNSGTRKAIFAGAVVVLVAGVVILWRILVPHTIAIQVTSIPDGASVTITAPNQPKFKHECVTPRCGLDLDPGRYALEIRHEGFHPSTKTIQVDANGAHSFPVTLVATATPFGAGISIERMADLQVRGLKDGSELYVDGKSEGRVGHQGEIAVQVPAGEHRVKVLAKSQKSIILVRNFVAGQVVSLGRDEFYPPTALAPEDVDWQRMLESTPTVDSLEKFLQKYPSGTHRAETRDILESLYWNKDSQANTPGSYREYLGHFPQGPHVAAAAEELAYLDASRQKDPASLDAFVSRYGSSRHRAEIEGLRDDAAWQRTNRDDENSVGTYLSSFPEGKHAAEAKGKLGELRDEAAWQRTNRGNENGLNAYLKAFPGGKYAEVAGDLIAKIHASASGGGVKPPRPSQKELDDAGIRILLKGYESAFDTRNVDALLKIWPSMGTREYRKLKDTFAAVSSISMQVEIRDIELGGTGDTATANTFMSQSAMVSGGGKQPPPHKDHAVFELIKTNGNWTINNVR